MKVTRILENLNDYRRGVELDQSSLIHELANHKALLLQSEEDPWSVHEFGHLLKSFNLKSYPYVGGAAPRRLIPCDAGDDFIYTANEAPPEAVIPFHHELAQTKQPPIFLFFFCDEPSITGGETALIDSTLVYRYAAEKHPEFMEKLRQHGARYVRTMPIEDDPKSPLGRSFYNTYQVKTIAEVEAKLNAIQGLEYEWLADGSLKVVTEPIPAVKYISQHHAHGIYQWTFHNSVIAAFVGWQDDRNDRLKAVRFGNDELMDPEVLEDIAAYMEANKVSYKWKKGDVFALHNQLVMHSRNSYEGTRRVYAAMFGDTQEETITHENLHIPKNPIAFGMWRLDDAETNTYQAIKQGFRRLDSACDYGNEVQSGRAIKRAIDEGLVNREELFITTKLWNTYHKPEHVPLAFDRCLNDLGLDYLDEFLIHFPISMEFVPFDKKYPPEWTNLEGKMVLVPNDINETWKAMEALKESGKVRNIGLSNFNCQHIRQVLSVARIPPSTLQIECHPQLSQTKLIGFAREKNIRVTVFSPLGGTSYISLGMSDESDLLFGNEVLKQIAAKHHKSVAQVMLRWAIQRNTIPISKSCSGSRMQENLSLFDFYLHQEDVRAINALNKNRRYNDPGEFCEAAFGTFCPIYE